MEDSLVYKNLLEVLNLDNLSDSQKTMLLDKMVDVVNQRLLIRVMDELPEDQKVVFEKILEKDEDNIKEVENFLITSVPNFLDIMSEETVKLKDEIINHLGKNKK